MKQTEKSKETLIDTAQSLILHGLVARTWGNLSRRTSPQHYLITPSGRDYETMSPADLVEMNLSGKWEGKLKPSGERGLHSAIYQQRQDAKFIIHTHQPFASAMSLAQQDLKIGGSLAKRIGAEVLPIADYGLPSTKKLHNSVLNKIQGSKARAVLMQAHGVVLYGETPKELVDLALDIEKFCQTKFLEITGKKIVKNQKIRHFERDDYDLPPQILYLFKHNDSAGAIIGLDDPILMNFKNTGLKAYLDDFSQLVGLKAGKTENGSIVYGRRAVYFLGTDLNEAQTLHSVAWKNALAATLAQKIGAKPIPKLDGIIMRSIYKAKYSKLKDSR